MDSLPACALTCLVEALKNSTCSVTDFDCICKDAQLNAALQPCVLQGCMPKEQLTTLNFSYTTCHYPISDNTKVFPIVNIVGVAVAILSVGIRLAGRLLNSTVGIDDFSILLALCTAIAISGVGFGLGANGLGKDMWMISFEKIDKILKLFFVEEVMYVMCIPLIKCSLLLLYLRLFPIPTLRRAILVTLAITACWGVASVLIQTFSCKPITYYWRSWDGEHKGKCLSHNALLLEHAIVNIVLDFVIIALPMPTLIKLKLSREKRLAMCLMFAVGIIVTIISIFRLVEAVGFNSTTNPTKDFVPVGIWSLLEVDIGIMCTCMPGIRSFIKYIWAILRNKNPHSNYGYGYGYGSSRAKASSNSAASHNRYPSRASQNQNTNQSQREFIRMQTSEESYPATNTKLAENGGQFIRLKEVEPSVAVQEKPPVPDKTKTNISSSQRGGGQESGVIRVKTELQTSRTKYAPMPPGMQVPRHDVKVSYNNHRNRSLPSLPSLPTRSPKSAHFTWFRDED